MKCAILSLVTSLAMAGATLAGKKFCQEIPYREWNQEQISKILTKSPWAHQFQTKISDQKISRKFKLKNMVVDGTPTL